MQNYLNELKTRSNNGDTDAQAILFFKLFENLGNYSETLDLCRKFRTTNLLLDAMCYYIGLKTDSDLQSICYDYRELNHKKCFEIFTYIDEHENDNQLKFCAQYMIARSYRNGMGVNKNAEKSLIYFEKAANNNNEWAQHTMGMALLNIEPGNSIKYFERAACQYNDLAIKKLGELYLLGKYHPPNSTNLLEWYLGIDPLDEDDLRCIKLLKLNGNINWDFKYHRYWPFLYEDVTSYSSIYYISSDRLCQFNAEIIILLLISKHRGHSKFPYVNYFSRLVATTTIKLLADIWIQDND